MQRIHVKQYHGIALVVKACKIFHFTSGVLLLFFRIEEQAKMTIFFLGVNNTPLDFKNKWTSIYSFCSLTHLLM